MRIRSLLTAVLSATLIAGGTLPAVTDLGATARADHAAQVTPATVTDEADETDEAAATPTLTVAPNEPVLSDAEGTLELQFQLSNPGDTEFASGELSIELSSKPIKTSAELTEALSAASADTDADTAADASAAALEFRTVATADLGATGANDEQRNTVSIAPADLPFDDDTAAGTYVVRASVTPENVTENAADPVLYATTPVVWRGVASRSVPLSIIVPFVLPEDIHTLPTRSQLGDLIPGWDELLTAAEDAQATLAIDPRILAAIRAYGTRAPDAAIDFLARLEASPNASFLLQFADADVAAQAALGFTSLLEPTNFDFVTRFGKFEAPETNDAADADAEDAADDSGDTAGSGSTPATTDPESDADPSATPNPAEADEPATGSDSNTGQGAGSDPDSTTDTDTDEADETQAGPPTLTELTAWPSATSTGQQGTDQKDSTKQGAVTVTAWPAENNVDQATLDLLTKSGITSYVLDSTNVKHSGGPRITMPEGTAVVTDAELAASAAQAAAGATEIERAAGLSQLAGELFVRAQSGGDGVVIGLNRGSVADAGDPAQLVAALAAFDFVQPVAVADQKKGTGSLRDAGPLEDRLALLRAAANREASVNEVGAVLVHPQYLSGYQRTRLLELFSTRYAAADSGFEEASTQFRTRDAELLEGVQAVSTEHTQLVSVSTSVPVQLHNSLPFDARVTMGAVPVSAALEVEQREFPDVLVGAEANERVLVPVRSRVSSGESGLVVTVSGEGGTPTVFTGTLALSISTNVETVALWIVGVSAGLLLVFGVYRSVRKRSRAKAQNLAVGVTEGTQE